MEQVTRRDVLSRGLRALGAIPILGTAFAASSPLVRFFRPTVKPYEISPPPDVGEGGELVVAKASELTQAWDYRYFLYTLRLPEYTPRGAQHKQVPGVVVRLPEGAGDDFMVISRICPHLGCIFNYERDPKGVLEHCNYPATGPQFCCPCHFSVYDPLQKDAQGRRGKVISGPAPRAPFQFAWRLEGDDIVVYGMEEGSTA